MLELSNEIAHDLHRHLVAQVEMNARLAAALGLEQAEDRLQQAARHMSEAFTERYGRTASAA